jgi:hypothetical protein
MPVSNDREHNTEDFRASRNFQKAGLTSCPTLPGFCGALRKMVEVSQALYFAEVTTWVLLFGERHWLSSS